MKVNNWDQKDRYQLIILIKKNSKSESGQSALVVCDENMNVAWTRAGPEMNSTSRFEKLL